MSTKTLILEAALKVFIEKGFAGASISKIAKAANINQSLIYHHFKSKEDLWICVKHHCVNQATQGGVAIRHDTLEHFIHDLINARLTTYRQGAMRMLVHWQAVESNFKELTTNAQPHPSFDVIDHVKALQKKGLIKEDSDPIALSALIFSLSSYAFYDFSEAFNLAVQQEENYKKLVFELLINALKKDGSI